MIAASHQAYHRRRAQEAMPRWEAVVRARQAGKKYREIAEAIGSDVGTVARMEQKFHRERLRLRQT